MTALGPVRSVSDDVPRTPRPRAALDGLPRWGTVRAWLSRLCGRPVLPCGTGRNRDAGSLTDRQMADIGLTRSDLPDHRGWRR